MNLIESYEIGESDPLSETLALLNVRGVLSRRVEAAGSWGLRFPASRHPKFGGVIKGERWLTVAGSAPPMKLEEGDFYLLNLGQSYCFASDPLVKPVDGPEWIKAHLDADGVVRFGKGEGRTVGVGGRFIVDEDSSQLLQALLPPVILIPSVDPAVRALRPLLDLIAFETEAVRLGGAALGAGLCSLVLVNILRAYLASNERATGWLGALGDRQIGVVIKAIHDDIGKRWTVRDMAGIAGMSRTAFSDRFKSLVAISPYEYIVSWRMIVARDLLKHGSKSLTAIAETVGYESEPSFSLAFKRRFGDSPGRYRIAKRKSQMQQGLSSKGQPFPTN